MGADRGERLLGDLVEASHLMSMQQIPTAVAEHAERAGIRNVLIYVADLQQSVLRLLPERDGQPVHPGEAAELRVEGTLAGRAFRTLDLVQAQGQDAGTDVWWAPLLDGTERIGVVRATVDGADEETLDILRRMTGLVALMVVSKRPYSDTHARLVRVQPMSVSAEMQWRLMPPLTFANDRVSIGAVLEPAYQIGGDAFDYGLAGDIVNLAIFDAMGHDTSSGLTATLAIAACRNSRLQGADLVETGRRIGEVLSGQFDSGTYVTALLASLDTRTGLLSWVNHGHPPPVVIRGGRWVTTLACPPASPLGTGLGDAAEACSEQLEPGDRLLLYTDGIIEARNAEKQEFGLHRFVDFIIRHNADGLPVPETLRRLIRGILDHHADRLDDDATVLLLEWHGPTGPGRPGPDDDVRQREVITLG
ncbi:PP2C family protein-serine/threonine phosphatase [Actinomadura rugatobispora]|uniref:PP2C family protein-serine/threonine phosphatase n=1 Tax=Actinomadura rugatobispora TaxID=1994 RepID=A0ABW1ACW1_9ACTN|nr:PP2C family protein-serine/threonine phosphatase [Actinomadura rugatobispora]